MVRALSFAFGCRVTLPCVSLPLQRSMFVRRVQRCARPVELRAVSSRHGNPSARRDSLREMRCWLDRSGNGRSSLHSVCSRFDRGCRWPWRLLCLQLGEQSTYCQFPVLIRDSLLDDRGSSVTRAGAVFARAANVARTRAATPAAARPALSAPSLPRCARRCACSVTRAPSATQRVCQRACPALSASSR